MSKKNKKILKIILPLAIFVLIFVILIIYFYTSDSTTLKTCGEGGIIYKNNNLCWQQDTKPGHSENFEDAKNYCEQLVLGEKEDWRLPTLIELEGTVDYNQIDPAIDQSVFKNTGSIPYWTSTPSAGTTENHMYVHFEKGYQGAGQDFRRGYGTRCVRDNTLF